MRWQAKAILAAAAVLGVGAILMSTTPPAPNWSRTASFNAVHFPTLITEISFSSTAMDMQFLDMLQELGVDCVTLHTSPAEFNSYRVRFLLVASGARARGMKVRFVLQDEPSISTTITGVPPTYLSPPTLDQYIATESAAAAGMAGIGPDHISVVSEPQTIESRIGTTFTPAQWITIVQQLTGAVKITNPNVKTWVAINVQSGKELGLIPNLANIGTLDGIGYDLYDHPELEATVSQAASFGNTKGKSSGLLETWWQDIFAHPQYDDPANAPSEASWIPDIYAFASNADAVSLFNPFFSHRFVTLEHIPSFTAASFTAFNAALAQALASKSRTVIFQAYQNLIAAYRANHK